MLTAMSKELDLQIECVGLDDTNTLLDDVGESLSSVLRALLSDERRSIVEWLSRSRSEGEVGMSISRVAEELESTRFSASRHLRILRECGVVTATRRGTAKIYSLRIESLWCVEDWILSITTAQGSSSN